MSKNNHVLSSDFKRDYPRVTHGKGIYMYTEDGQELMDGASGPVLASLGHANEFMINAMHEQAKKIVYAHRDDCVTEVLEEACEGIYDLSNGLLDKSFFVSGGSEANECAIKLARSYHLFRGNMSKFKVMSRWQSYHGSTDGVLSVSGFTSRRTGYEPYLREFGHIAPAYCYRCWYGKECGKCNFECAQALEYEIMAQGPETVSAFIAEPIEGMSIPGAVPPDGYFKEIKRICEKYDVLLIADEVMTGMGRTGKAFAYQHFGIEPDIVSTAKAIGGGYYPLGAVSISKRVFEEMDKNNGSFGHGYSWGGNPMGGAIASATFKYLKEHDLINRSAQLGEYIKEQINEKFVPKHAMIGDVRGRGLMIGIELVKDRETKESFDPKLGLATLINREANKHNLIIESSSGCNHGQAGDCLMISPAFIITKEEIDELLRRLDLTLTVIEEKYDL